MYVNPLKQAAELAFSGQTAVPVVKLGERVLVDSTPVCLQLDAALPENRVLPAEPALKEKCLAHDRWVTDRLIPTGFYTSQNLPLLASLKNGWLSGRIHHVTTPGGLPLVLRLLWPLLVLRANFVGDVIAGIDPALTVAEARAEVANEFVERLEGGPYLGGQGVPSLADCAAYGHFVPCWLGGMTGYSDVTERAEIRDWVKRMTPLVYDPRPFWPAQITRRQVSNL